jgi:hypothetical protein
MKDNLKETSQAPKPEAGFLRLPEPAWMLPPIQAFQYFNIKSPHFYMINGQAMAFAADPRSKSDRRRYQYDYVVPERRSGKERRG